MHTDIVRIPSGTLPDGPSFVVVPAGHGTLAELYARGTHGVAPGPAGKPMLALMRTDLLATPDRLAVLATSRVGAVFTIELEIKAYRGPLAANDPWIGLVSVDLGSLEPDKYEFAVKTTIRSFDDLRRPENASAPEISERRFRFECE